MEQEHLDIAALREARNITTQSPADILSAMEDYHDPQNAENTYPDPQETLAEMLAYIFGGGMHPDPVIFRTYTLLLSLDDSVTNFELARSTVPIFTLLNGSADDRSNAIRKKPIDNAADIARRILITALDRGLIKSPTDFTDSLPPLIAENPNAPIIAGFFLERGAEPRHCIRRIYAAAKAWKPHYLGDAALQVLADLTGEKRQAWSTFCLRILDAIAEHSGTAAAAYTKPEGSRETYSTTATEAWKDRRERYSHDTDDDAEDAPLIG